MGDWNNGRNADDRLASNIAEALKRYEDDLRREEVVTRRQADTIPGMIEDLLTELARGEK